MPVFVNKKIAFGDNLKVRFLSGIRKVFYTFLYHKKYARRGKGGILVVALPLFMAIGFSALLFATSRGIGISPDSVTYIMMARNMLYGTNSYILSSAGRPVFIAHFPPLFPAALAITGALGIDPLNAARWLNSFLFAANILLVGFIINKVTRSGLISIYSSLLMLTSVDMLKIHSMAWSEPLFILLSIAGLFFLASYIESAQRAMLVLSSATVALAFLTRYIGVALVCTGVAAILFLSKERLGRKIADGVIFASIGLAPISLWFLRNFFVAGAAIDRKIIFHPARAQDFRFAVHTVVKWILPQYYRGFQLRDFLILVIGGLLLLYILRKGKGYKSALQFVRPAKFLQVLLVFVSIYILCLVIAAWFFDRPPFDYRVLSPLFISVLIFILSFGYKLLYPTDIIGIVKNTVIVLCVVFAGFYLRCGISHLIYVHTFGLGYTSRAWENSRIIQKVKVLPQNAIIYTNGPDVIYIFTGRLTFFLPWKNSPSTGKNNPQYLSELAQMKKELREKHGLLVYFDKITWRNYLTSPSELKQHLPLYPLTRLSDGTIYEIIE